MKEGQSKIVKALLIADDEEYVVDLMRMEIEKTNLVNEIIHFSGSIPAIQYIEKNREPNLILLDINLMRMAGWQFLVEVSKRKICTKSIIAIVSISKNPADKEGARQLKHVCITKLLTQKTFLDLVGQVFNNQATAA